MSEYPPWEDLGSIAFPATPRCLINRSASWGQDEGGSPACLPLAQADSSAANLTIDLEGAGRLGRARLVSAGSLAAECQLWTEVRRGDRWREHKWFGAYCRRHKRDLCKRHRTKQRNEMALIFQFNIPMNCNITQLSSSIWY